MPAQGEGQHHGIQRPKQHQPHHRRTAQTQRARSGDLPAPDGQPVDDGNRQGPEPHRQRGRRCRWIRACRPLTAENPLVAWNLELAGLERLAAVHFQKALPNGDIPHSAIYQKYNEQICAMLGCGRRCQLPPRPSHTATRGDAAADHDRDKSTALSPRSPTTARTATQRQSQQTTAVAKRCLAALNNLAYDPLYGGKAKEPGRAKADRGNREGGLTPRNGTRTVTTVQRNTASG